MENNEYYVVRDGSTSLSNDVIWSGLSYEALGLLMTELALGSEAPEDDQGLVKPGTDEARVRKARRELEAAGFRHRVLVRESDGSLKNVTLFSDESTSTREALNEITLPEGSVVVEIQTNDDAGRGDHDER